MNIGINEKTLKIIKDNLGKTPLSYTKSRDAEEILKAAGAKF